MSLTVAFAIEPARMLVDRHGLSARAAARLGTKSSGRSGERAVVSERAARGATRETDHTLPSGLETREENAA